MLLKNLVHCVLAFTVAFAGLALLFLELDAQFAGFAQILVYIGAVAIFIVFAILLTRSSELPREGVFSRTWFVGLVIAAAVFAVLGWAVLQSVRAVPQQTAVPAVTVHDIGNCAGGPLRAAARNRRSAAHCGHHRRGHRGHARERGAQMTSFATPLAGYLLVAALLFAIGLAGALTRRNAILVLIGIELMLNAANLNLIAFWRYGPHPEALTGMMFAIFSIAVAAAEAAVGLGLVIAIYRHANTTDLDKMNRMKG